MWRTAEAVQVDNLSAERSIPQCRQRAFVWLSEVSRIGILLLTQFIYAGYALSAELMISLRQIREVLLTGHIQFRGMVFRQFGRALVPSISLMIVECTIAAEVPRRVGLAVRGRAL